MVKSNCKVCSRPRLDHKGQLGKHCIYREIELEQAKPSDRQALQPTVDNKKDANLRKDTWPSVERAGDSGKSLTQ